MPADAGLGQVPLGGFAASHSSVQLLGHLVGPQGKGLESHAAAKDSACGSGGRSCCHHHLCLVIFFSANVHGLQQRLSLLVAGGLLWTVVLGLCGWLATAGACVNLVFAASKGKQAGNCQQEKACQHKLLGFLHFQILLYKTLFFPGQTAGMVTEKK